jgi:hypothetical protein
MLDLSCQVLRTLWLSVLVAPEGMQSQMPEESICAEYDSVP